MTPRLTDSAWYNNRPPEPITVKWRRWLGRWRSAIVRFSERRAGGTNLYDWLVTDFDCVAHLASVAEAIESAKCIEDARVERPLSPLPGVALPASHAVRSAVWSYQFRYPRVHVEQGLVQLPSGHAFMGSDGVMQAILVRGGLAQEAADLSTQLKSTEGHWTIVPATRYYYHHIVDGLLPLVKAIRLDPSVSIAVAPRQPDWFYEAISAVAPGKTLNQVKVLNPETLLWVDRSLPDSSDVQLLRSRVSIREETISHGVLFVTRKGFARFEDESENQIRQELKGLISVEVDPAELDFVEQVRLFSSASVIVGAHGGGLTNMIWASNCKLVVEVFGEYYRGRQYSALARACGIEYRALVPRDIEGLRQEVLRAMPI